MSCENQHFADERIPLLLQTPAAVRFISAEPLLGPVDLARYLDGHEEHGTPFDGAPHVGGCVAWTPPLDWVICGGESGPGARPFNLAWTRSIVAQCKTAGVPVFVKQLGANAVCRNDEPDEPWPGCIVPIDDDYAPRFQGEAAPLVFRDRKGGDPSEWSADLRVREFPALRS